MAHTQEDYPPLLLLAMLHAACRCLETFEYTHHFHDIAFSQECDLEFLARTHSVVQCVARSWGVLCLQNLWMARAALLAVDDVLARAQCVHVLTDSQLWNTVWSRVQHTRVLTEPNFVHCSFTVAFQLLCFLHPGHDELASWPFVQQTDLAEMWLIGLKLGITPVVAFWLASAGFSYLCSRGVFRRSLVQYCAGHARHALYLCDEISVRT